MDSSGQLFRLHKKYFKQFNECKSLGSSGVKSIGYDKIGAIFILLGFATLLSFLLMLFEILLKKVLLKQEKNIENTKNND